ncbi:sigma-70 family RNA polymerase sigma factor [Eubacteriales bacterium OttesenSCG-928-N13]|nr:sigma-70 family RNA polymerase sigma factor [Eubacteriales bacterium OttesenSCG-928-N13]
MLEVMYDLHFRRVYNYISYRINDHSNVDDLVSTVFLRAIDKHAQFDSNRGSLSGWIIGIARNVVIDYYRMRDRNQMTDIAAIEHSLPSDENMPERIVVQNEEHRALITALSELPERERQIIALKFGAELSNREIARQLGLSISNVGVLLFRCLRRLKARLSKGGLP